MGTPTAEPTDAGRCPADADLSQFLDESLPADAQAALAGHIDTCPRCQTRLDQLDRDTEPVSRYKTLAQTPPSPLPALPFPPPKSDPNRTKMLFGPATPAVTFDGLPHVPGFELISEIGRGGMGVVYKARHKQLNRLVALKVVIAGGAADARSVQRFLFEAEVLARIQHEQVVHVYDVGTYRGPCGVPIPYLAMELLEGGTLAAFAARRPQSPRTAAALVEGLARAVHAVHLQGVVHRDLKPGNILFSAECGIRNAESKTKNGSANGYAGVFHSALRVPHSALLPKVSDFGLAKFTEGAVELTASGMVVGTPGYMAPEQASGSKQIDTRADVYAIGAILFELLTGRPPFDGTEPMSVLVKVLNGRPPHVRSVRPQVPRDLAAVTMRCLEKSPDDRYPSAEALADDLGRFLANRPTAARPRHPLEVLWMAVARNPTVSILTFLLLVAVGIGIGLGIAQWQVTKATAEVQQLITKAALDMAGRAESAERQAKERQLRMTADQAVRWCEDGQLDRGLAAFTDALELAEQTNDTARERAIRVNLAAWPERQFPRLAWAEHKTGKPLASAFTPDGKLLLTVGENAEARAFDAGTGGPVRAYQPNPFQVAGTNPVAGTWKFWCVAASADGTRFAAGGSDGQVWVWDTDKSLSVAAHKVVRGRSDVWAVAFAPDGTLWAGDGAGRLTRLDPLSGKVLARTPDRFKSPVVSVAVSKDGSRVFAGDRGGAVHEWDAADPRVPVRRFPVGGWVRDVALSPDETLLAVTGTAARAEVWDRVTGERRWSVGLAGAHGTGVTFLDPQTVVVSDNDGYVRLWHTTAGSQPGTVFRVPGGATAVRVRPQSPALAAGGGPAVGVWGLPRPRGRMQPVVAPDDGEPVRSLDYHPDGRLLAVRRAVTVYPPAGGKPAAFEPDTPTLSARFDRGRPRLIRTDRTGWAAFDPAAGTEVRSNAARMIGSIGRAEVAPDGATFLTAGGAKVHEWDAGTDQLRRVLPLDGLLPPALTVKVVRYRPDGRELMLAAGRTILFVDPVTLAPTRDRVRTPDAVEDACYLGPAGDRVLVGLRNNAAQVYDAATGRPAGDPLPHPFPVIAVGAAADGVLVTACRDGTARYWDAASGLPLGASLRHPAPLTALAVSPDGRAAATGTLSGQVTVWPVPPPPALGSADEFRHEFARRGLTPTDPAAADD